TIPAGSVLISDPVNLAVPDFARLAIDFYLPARQVTSPSPVPMPPDARQRSYVSLPGDHTGASDLPVMTTTQAWSFLARVEVTAPTQVGAVVAFGDSITDGTRWPHDLAKRLAARGLKLAVFNQGISGNPFLSDGAGTRACGRV